MIVKAQPICPRFSWCDIFFGIRSLVASARWWNPTHSDHSGAFPTRSSCAQFSTELATWRRATFLSISSTILLTFSIFMLLLSLLPVLYKHTRPSTAHCSKRLTPSLLLLHLLTLEPGIHSRLINFTIFFSARTFLLAPTLHRPPPLR